MAKYIVYEYGEAKAEGRTAIVDANSREEAIKNAPFQEWGATAQRYCKCSICLRNYPYSQIAQQTTLNMDDGTIAETNVCKQCFDNVRNSEEGKARHSSQA